MNSPTTHSIKANFLHRSIKRGSSRNSYPNMKHFSIVASALLCLILFPPCAAITEDQIRILLNNGAAASDMSCSAPDMVNVLKALIFTRRNLRQGSNKVNEKQILDVDESVDNGRKLPLAFYPSTCKISCQGFATGTCVAPACKGFRRETKEEENDRDLWFTTSQTSGASKSASVFIGTSASNGTSSSSGFVSMSTTTSTNADSFTWCDTAKSNVNRFLDLLIKGGVISSSCVKLLQAPRKLECLTVSC
jgi:hypothetical protein